MAGNDDVAHERYPNVFSPVKLGPVEIPNRIYMAPHGIPLEVKSDGADLAAEPAINRAHYFGERAAGGTGLIIHSTQVISSQTNFGESPGHDAAIPAFRRVADEVHRHGARIFAEIWYVNWIQKTWERLGPEAPAMAPSELPTLYYPAVRRAMKLREIDHMVEAFRRTARNLRKADYDGIELHVSHGSIVEYFLSPYFNHRTDEYGGSLENRARFLVRILEAIREEQGADQALGIRINADELLPGGLDEAATKEVLVYLRDRNLVDFIDLDVSVEPEQAHLMTTGMFDPILHNAERAARVGEAAGNIPVLMTPGRLTSIADAEKLIASGKTAMVGAARGLIAEPEMVNKSREGREKERRICVAINACVDPLSVGWGCAINPTAGKEHRWGKAATGPVARPRKVVVVGGGPAGSEAARIAATRGNQVTLFERNDRLGGGVIPWGSLPGRDSMRTLPNYFELQLEQLGVDVRRGTEANADTLLGLGGDVVVLATGSRYNRQGISGPAPRPLPGHDLDHVLFPEDIFEGRPISGKVVVIDDEGYHTACGIAEKLALEGCEVVYVARKAMVGASLGLAIGHVSARLRQNKVKIVTGHIATGIKAGSVTLYEAMTGSQAVEEGVDHVVLCTFRNAVADLYDALDGRVPHLFLIGDALAPRSLRDAIYEGHRFGRLIGEDDMPETTLDELFRSHSEGALVSAARG